MGKDTAGRARVERSAGGAAMKRPIFGPAERIDTGWRTAFFLLVIVLAVFVFGPLAMVVLP
jgi:hypothetical protein